MNMNEPPSLLRNDVSGTHHWLKVLLTGTTSNRSAIGAQIVVQYGERRQAQAVMAQSSYLSVNDRRLHPGLGAAAIANLEILWPNGGVEKIAGVPADRFGGDPGRLRNRSHRTIHSSPLTRATRSASPECAADRCC